MTNKSDREADIALETEAIHRLQGGDIRGLEALVRCYQVRATQMAYLICRDWSTAEDIVQTSFLQIYERIQQFDTSRPFGPWFLRSVVNQTLMSARHEQYTVSLDTGNAGQSFDDLLAAPEDGSDPDTREAVWNALGALTPEQRAVIVQRYYLEMSEVEMGRAQDCPPGTIKWRLHAARKRLRALLRPVVQEGLK